MKRHSYALLGTVLCCLVVNPAVLTTFFHTVGPPERGSWRMMAVGLFAMMPGVLMGAAALGVMIQMT